MRTILSLFTMLLLGVLLWQCNSREVTTEERIEEGKAPVATELSYQTKMVEMQSNPCGGGTPCASVYLSAPILNDTSNPAQQRIQQQIMKEMTRAFMEEEKFNNLNEVANGFIEAYRLTQGQNQDYEQSWSLTRSAEVYVNTDTLFGIRYSGSIFMGGAHPVETLRYLNFDPATVKLLTMDELFGPARLKEWTVAAEVQFREDQEIPAEANLEEAGYWFSNNQFYLPENFELKKDSVIFYFNPHEVAPYAAGTIRIALER
ncbi:DUF3298 and DUF4163 domain-containing protein [Nafulsella turpanensis]|uniref:DUF3298 and DUF4163 domain-containing protein n=1 Tax=Nafulsella turpanensis TaxID=1265690 RepID=UPI000347F3B9|nr:DUF3298 and DUF4163 domain-containing protein [Nafulsella turpanensis]